MVVASAAGGFVLSRYKATQVTATTPVPVAAAANEPVSATSQDPNTQAARKTQADAAELKREAVEVARELSEAYPTNALAYALLGSAFYNTGQSGAAIEQLRKCLELNPGLGEAYEILARVAYDKGETEETIRLCREALRRGPATADVLNQLGRALMDQGRTEDAVRTLRQAVELPKPAAESSYLLGQASLQAGEFAAAKASFRKAIELIPDHTQAYFGLYTACTRLGEDDEAQRYRSEFVRLEGVDRGTLSDRSGQEDILNGLNVVRKTVARTVFGAAQIRRMHGEMGKAGGFFLRAAELDPDNATFRMALEGFHGESGSLVEGRKAFERLTSSQPNNRLNHLFLGRVQARLGDFAAAERSYREVQRIAPRWGEGYRALAEQYLRSEGRAAECVALARRAAELEPSGAYYLLLAQACLKNQDRMGARTAVEQALARNPRDPRAQQLLQQILQSP